MKKSIVCIAFYIPGTGLTRVMDALVQQFRDEYMVHYVGVGYKGPRIEQPGLTIYPTNLEGGDVMGSYFARELIEAIEPECVFILQDVWHFQRYMMVFDGLRDKTKIVGYTPIDGEVTNPESVSYLLGLDTLVLYTDWARDQVRNALLEIAPEEKLPRMEVVAHGVDTKQFYQLEGRQAVRKEVFPGLEEDAFVVLNASRPCVRKRVDLTLRAFAAFAEDKPAKVKLCLHQAIREEQSLQLLDLIKELDIEDRVVLNPFSGRRESEVLSDEDLNKLYNACDVGVNSSMGEGWGLVSFEHAATGAAQIVPDHTACAELWKDSGIVVKTEPSEIGQISPFVMTQPTLKSLQAAFELLYSNFSERERLAELCYQNAQREAYTWEAIAKQWESVFQAAVSLPNNQPVLVG